MGSGGASGANGAPGAPDAGRNPAGDAVMRHMRPPERVMRLERLGASYPTRLSFMRSLLRRMAREGWRFERERSALDAQGYGHAVYAAHAPGRSFRLVVFSDALAPEARTDRVIAEQWDVSFVLADGAVADADIARLRANVPKQEAGRVGPQELVLSRANRSVRLFDHVVERLAAGRQPDPARLAEVGYLVRTTAVYGNGKFGLADLGRVRTETGLERPYEAEMLAIYLVRWFVLDLVEHIAAARGGAGAARLANPGRRMLGIGNATGLGMAPYLVKHPVLIHNWLAAREEAFARVRALPAAEPAAVRRFLELFRRAHRHVGEWQTGDRRFAERIARLRAELQAMLERLPAVERRLLGEPEPWDRLMRDVEARCSIETQELLLSLILEPHGGLVDELEDRLAARTGERADPRMSVERLLALLDAQYGWALRLDFDRPDATHLFWYYSAEKEEPRLGERHAEPGAEREMRLGVAREIQAFRPALAAAVAADPGRSVARFMLEQPRWRAIARRVQTVAGNPYGEIRDNMLDRACVPIDLLRCKLAYFGAVRFDPKSDRWTRICMYQGAPQPDELTPATAEDWAFPVWGDG